MKENSRLTKRHPKNNEERTKLERSSDIALHVLETEHHVDFTILGLGPGTGQPTGTALMPNIGSLASIQLERQNHSSNVKLNFSLSK